MLRYTVMYLCLAVPMVVCLLVSGRTFLWGGDALYQQYTTLAYTSNALRDLFSGNGFAMVDTALGQGMDSIATLSYYGLTDPFQWLGALFTGRGLEIYYHFLLFLYIYLTGLVFGIYIRQTVLKREQDGWIIAIAALVFASCGYQTIGIIKNPYYASGSIYLMLMLIAVERILRERKWLMMSLITLLMLLANFYLAYQTTLIVIVYILVRLIAGLRQKGVKKSAGDGFTLMGAYLLGLTLSMVFLLPAAINFLNSGRVDLPAGYTNSLLHYPWAYYLKLAALFCAPYDQAGYWALQSFSPMALFGVAYLFSRKSRKDLRRPDANVLQLRAGFLLAVACLCIPLLGKLFNGMGYATNRWSYGFSAIVCLIAAWAMPRFLDADYAGRGRMAVFGLIWALMMLVYGLFAHKIKPFNGAGNAVAVSDYSVSTKNIAPIAGAMAVGASSVCLMLLDRPLRLNRAKAMRVLAALMTLCCTAYSIGYGVVAATSDEFYDIGIDEQVRNQTAAVAGQLEDDGFYRVDTGTANDNHAPLLGYNGTAYYWSIIPQWVSEHYTGLELSSQRWIFRMDGSGMDTYLNALASVKYSVRNAEDIINVVPYGYDLSDTVVQEDGDAVQIYKNRYALPLGYVFEEVMSETDYNALEPVEKRQALISCAVLEDAQSDLDSFVPDFEVREVEWEIADADNVVLANNTLMGQKNGVLTLKVQGVPDGENYLLLQGTQVLSAADDTDTMFYTLSEAGVNRMYFILPTGNFNYNQTGSCVNLGYSENGLAKVQLRFRDDAVLRFDELKIISTPVGYYQNAVEEILSRGTWDAKVENNRAAGGVVLEKPGILQISLPYSSGWTAVVDGEEAQIVRCGGMYMGISLDAGEHYVELRYETPGLRAGMWISLAGLAVLAIWLAAGRLRRRRSI